MQQNVLIGLLIIAIIGVGLLIARPQVSSLQNTQPSPSPIAKISPVPCHLSKENYKTPETDKLITQDIKVGTGKEAKSGDTVVMHYRGLLTDGTQFDSSCDRGEPFTTVIGKGQVIKGWDEGVPGMKVGGIRKLIIPADLGYGAQGAGGVIPPNATLVFEVELLDVK